MCCFAVKGCCRQNWLYAKASLSASSPEEYSQRNVQEESHSLIHPESIQLPPLLLIYKGKSKGRGYRLDPKSLTAGKN
jgi:hypothetical protein